MSDLPPEFGSGSSQKKKPRGSSEPSSADEPTAGSEYKPDQDVPDQSAQADSMAGSEQERDREASEEQRLHGERPEYEVRQQQEDQERLKAQQQAAQRLAEQRLELERLQQQHEADQRLAEQRFEQQRLEADRLQAQRRADMLDREREAEAEADRERQAWDNEDLVEPIEVDLNGLKADPAATRRHNRLERALHGRPGAVEGGAPYWNEDDETLTTLASIGVALRESMTPSRPEPRRDDLRQSKPGSGYQQRGS